jgi:hypothetical protein
MNSRQTALQEHHARIKVYDTMATNNTNNEALITTSSTLSSASIAPATLSINVVARFRPLNKRELKLQKETADERCITLHDNDSSSSSTPGENTANNRKTACTCFSDSSQQQSGGGSRFTFDTIFDEHSKQVVRINLCTR